MHYSALVLAVATLTVGGQAFLIPPNVNRAPTPDDEFALLNLAGSSPNNRVLKAACKGCLADGKDGALVRPPPPPHWTLPPSPRRKFKRKTVLILNLDLRPRHLQPRSSEIPPQRGGPHPTGPPLRASRLPRYNHAPSIPLCSASPRLLYPRRARSHKPQAQ